MHLNVDVQIAINLLVVKLKSITDQITSLSSYLFFPDTADSSRLQCVLIRHNTKQISRDKQSECPQWMRNFCATWYNPSQSEEIWCLTYSCERDFGLVGFGVDRKGASDLDFLNNSKGFKYFWFNNLIYVYIINILLSPRLLLFY